MLPRVLSLLTLNKLELYWKHTLNQENAPCPHKTDLWASSCWIFFVDYWCWRVQLTVGGVSPWLVLLGAIKKMTKKTNLLYSSVPSHLFCLQVPASCSCPDFHAWELQGDSHNKPPPTQIGFSHGVVLWKYETQTNLFYPPSTSRWATLPCMPYLSSPFLTSSSGLLPNNVWGE